MAMAMGNKGRTTLLLALVLAAALVVLAACGGGTGSQDENGSAADDQITLVVTSYGGSYDEVLIRSAIEPFEDAHPGVTIELAPYASVAKLAAQEGQGIDIVQLDDFDIVDAAQKGLLRPLTANERLSYWDDLYPQAFLRDEEGDVYGLANVFGSWGIAYNTEKVQPAPTSWRVFWDEAYADRVAHMEQWIPDWLVTAAAFGGSPDDMSPVWEAYRALTPSIKQYYGSFSAPEALLKSEDAWVVSWFDGRTHALADEGVPVAFVLPEEGGALIRGALGITATSKHPELAEEFINFLMSPEVQAAFSNDFYYGPTNRTVELPDELAARVVYGEEDLEQLIVPDWAEILPRRADWANAWNEAVRY